MENFDYESAYQGGPGTTILSLAISVLAIIALWKIFEKAGEPGWAAIIPFYNLYVLFKITWGNGWKFLLMLIPIANIVFAIITMVKLAKAFGKSLWQERRFRGWSHLPEHHLLLHPRV